MRHPKFGDYLYHCVQQYSEKGESSALTQDLCTNQNWNYWLKDIQAHMLKKLNLWEKERWFEVSGPLTKSQFATYNISKPYDLDGISFIAWTVPISTSKHTCNPTAGSSSVFPYSLNGIFGQLCFAGIWISWPSCPSAASKGADPCKGWGLVLGWVWVSCLRWKFSHGKMLWRYI